MAMNRTQLPQFGAKTEALHTYLQGWTLAMKQVFEERF
jgi:hypothetical protein